MDTQADSILAALQAGRALTPLEALDEFGCFRLGARIWDLRQAGHPIIREMVHIGPENKLVARYRLPAPKPAEQLSLSLA